MRGIDEGRAGVEADGHAQGFGQFLARCAGFERALGVHGDAGVAARGRGHGQGDQFPRLGVERAMDRAGIGPSEARISLITSALPETLLAALELKPENLGSLNELCLTIRNLDEAGQETLGAAVQLAKSGSISEVQSLAR